MVGVVVAAAEGATIELAEIQRIIQAYMLHPVSQKK